MSRSAVKMRTEREAHKSPEHSTNIADRQAFRRAWVAEQEATLNQSFGEIKPGSEWLRNYPKSWTLGANGSAEEGNDARDEIINTCLSLPDGTPEPILRGTFIANLLKRTKPVVLPGFDLVGHWVLDGRFVWEPVTLPEIDQTQREKILEEHPFRSMSVRFDHAAPDTKRLLQEGIGGILNRIDHQLALPCQPKEKDLLAGMKIAVEAFSAFAVMQGAEAARMGRTDISASLQHIATHPPRSYYEALQLIWLCYVVFTRERRSAMAFGRLDQHLIGFYRADLAAGRITREKALDLLCEMFAYVYWTNTAAMTIGGMLPDGTDGANEVSLLILEAAGEMRIPMVSLFARFGENSPREYLEACAKLILAGGGMPAMMNDEVSVKQLAALGVTGGEAYDHCFTGCAHLYLEGRQVAWTEKWVVLPPLLLKVLKAQRGTADTLTWNGLLASIREEIQRNVAEGCTTYNANVTRINAENSPDVFYSALIADCIERRKECNDGGARYKGVIGVDVYGLASAADMLAALKVLVFDRKRYSFEEVMEATEQNFEGSEPMRQELLQAAPKYGNDDPVVDGIAAQLLKQVSDECTRQQESLCDGSYLRVIFPGTASYVRIGKELPATPDGRRAGEPISDSGAPVTGRDMKGLTALMNSLGAVDHSQFNGMALNVRLSRQDFSGAAGLLRFKVLLDVMRSKGLQELQFNCISSDELRQAQRDPEQYRNLLIRVAGYSDRFTNLQPDLQNTIIERNEYQ